MSRGCGPEGKALKSTLEFLSAQVIKGGKTETGKQRYRCQQTDCPHRSFVLEPTHKGRSPEIKAQIIDMALNGSGIRDTARVLKISTNTVLSELKKRIFVKLYQSPVS